MTTTALPPAHIPAARVSLWDRLTVVLLGALGFALSYDALRQMAAAIHVRGPLTYVFPLIIDGFIAYGVRALLVLREAPRPARAYAWTLFTGATAASVWANALHAVRLNDLAGTDSRLRLSDTVVGFLSILAPLALGGAVHLYILIARHGENTEIRRGEQIDDSHGGASADPVTADHDEDVQPQRTEHRSDETALLTLLSAAGLLPSEWSDALPGHQAAEGNDQPSGTANTAAGESAEAADKADESQVGGSDSTAHGKPVGRPPGASMEQLLEVSCAAVAAHGRVTRAVVEQAVREAGLPLGSTRLTELMNRLRRERGGEEGRSHPEAD
ncbi:DUF2637 domain-containing protein [Kitasatospora sp. NPDC052896]|uniref:DUF2637 domain-containing protein n=1 Tax=Kitasatospora sp. NPDC052896 TaxID=3364061 RepID=UPI0037C5D2D4